MGISYVAGQHSQIQRILPGYISLCLALLSIGCHIYLSKLAALDPTLGKRRDDALPFRWWVKPGVALLLSLVVLYVFMVYTLG